MNDTTLAVTPETFVFASNDEIKTTSLLVAEKFGKLHKDVLRKIKTLDCSEDFAKRNFTLSKYEVIGGKNTTREEDMYEMTKDGFMFLVMGFTGKAAAQIKEAYINAFNLMHAKLFPKPYALKETAPTFASIEMQRHVQEMVHARVATTGKHYNTIYDQIKTQFEFPRLENLPVTKYLPICDWFGGKPKYKMPEFVTLPVDELEILRLPKPKAEFQIKKQKDDLVQYTAYDSENNKFAMIPIEKWDAIQGELVDDENILVVRPKTKQVMTAREYLDIVADVHKGNPSAPYVLLKKEPLLALKKVLAEIV